MIDLLKSIGIEKGKPFNPDAKTQDILKRPPAKRTPGSMLRYETHVRALLRRSALGASRRRRS